MIVLYDADCGFCRWAMAWAVRLDDDDRLTAVPIQSSLGGELLVDLDPSDRLRAAHVIGRDGLRRSAGDAAADVLGALPSMRVPARLARSSPRATGVLYGLVARRRVSFGRLVGRRARERADRLLETASVQTAQALKRRGIAPPT